MSPGSLVWRGWPVALLGRRDVSAADVVGVDNLALRIPLDAQLHQLVEGLGEMVEEELLVLSVLVHPHRELGVREQGHVRRQHHERLLALLLRHVLVHVIELLRPVRERARLPLELLEQPEILV